MARKPAAKVYCPVCHGEGNMRTFAKSGMSMHIRNAHPEYYEEFKNNKAALYAQYTVPEDGAEPVTEVVEDIPEVVEPVTEVVEDVPEPVEDIPEVVEEPVKPVKPKPKPKPKPKTTSAKPKPKPKPKPKTTSAKPKPAPAENKSGYSYGFFGE